MRLAVSGTHGSGKTTLIEDFVAAHPDYAHEPEPYETLSEAGVAFADPPLIDDYLQQLEHSIETLHAHRAEENIIFDRCPIDFIAYLEVLGRRTGPDTFDVDSALEEVEEAIETLDLIVFLPLPPGGAMEAEHPALQRAVDRELRSILLDDGLSLLASGKLGLIALSGSPLHRLRALEREVTRRPGAGGGRK